MLPNTSHRVISAFCRQTGARHRNNRRTVHRNTKLRRSTLPACFHAACLLKKKLDSVLAPSRRGNMQGRASKSVLAQHRDTAPVRDQYDPRPAAIQTGERESDLKYSRRALSSPAAAKVFILRGPSGTVSLHPLREFTRMLIMLSCCPSSPSSRGVRPTETEPPSPKTACEVFHGSSAVHLRHPAVPGHAQFRAKTSRALHGLLLRRHAAQSAHDPSFSR